MNPVTTTVICESDTMISAGLYQLSRQRPSSYLRRIRSWPKSRWTQLSAIAPGKVNHLSDLFPTS